MNKQIEFIKPITPEERNAAEPEAAIARAATEAIDTTTASTEADDSISFTFPSLAIRKRAINIKRKGLIQESEIDTIVATPHASVADVDSLFLELVVDKENFLPACFLQIGADYAKAVCKVATHGVDFEGNSDNWAGTGILVGENILLTNHHVLNSVDTAQNATCIFNYQVDGKNVPQQTKEFTLDPKRLFITSPVKVKDEKGKWKRGLDYTFVWINGKPAAEYSFIPLNRSSFNIVEGERANIIQHPNGHPKVVALQDNNVTMADDLIVVHYATDTDRGSSGAFVLNNEWKPIALHHASAVNSNRTPENNSKHINEGIKLSAIAAHIEQRSQQPEYAKPAGEVLKLFKDVDTTMGFFGGLGRKVDPDKIGVEKVVDSYKGEDDDIDVGFWNIEWFNKRFDDKVDKVADVVANMNLDIWGFSEASLEATEKLVAVLKEKYNLNYACLGSEPDASSAKQTNTVLWNTKTLKVKKIDWPEDVKDWFLADSRHFDELGLNLESVEGPIFPRVAQPYLVSTKKRSREKETFAFNFLPLHLKAMAEGSLRRKMASRILGAAIDRMRERDAFDQDWVIGGDVNAPLATNDFKTLLPDMTPLSAADEQEGAFSYLKRPKSLIDHIFLSREMTKTFGKGNYFVVAAEKGIPNYVKEISDHRPVLVRLSLYKTAMEGREERDVRNESLERLIKTLNEKFPPKQDMPMDLKPKELLQ